MKTTINYPTLVAITGGSGSGKSWLAKRLVREFGKNAMSFSLDNFYRDQSGLSEEDRKCVNFDLPTAIEWTFFKKTLRTCARRNLFNLPQYDFKKHCRCLQEVKCEPPSIVIVDGLWLLHRPDVRRMFDLTLFLDCPEDLRMHRRIYRDVEERGKPLPTSWQDFHQTVNAMHSVYVAPQKSHAHRIVQCPFGESEITSLQQSILEARAGNTFESASPYDIHSL